MEGKLERDDSPERSLDDDLILEAGPATDANEEEVETWLWRKNQEQKPR